jgi:hypothetical protein
MQQARRMGNRTLLALRRPLEVKRTQAREFFDELNILAEKG